MNLVWFSCLNTNYNLENLKTTKEELFKEAVFYATRNDSKSMDKIILNRKEHNEFFWKHVGERFTSDPGMTPDLAYDHMSLETRIAWRELIRDLNGKNLEFSKVECTAPSEVYGPFTLIRGCISYFRNLDTDEMIQIKKIRNIIQYNGKVKIYNLKRD
ncbi:MAG TPA: hypothetical protein PK079_06215 [Leptospiraceae bacterium]|nr:hypothetical protein [Leptospiraceae bacterium]HMY31170.1 hypothetical protein [Leptospiraceae bacterium]HNE52752.1 hypothetical protein [Leptospiraceae bacterium]